MAETTEERVNRLALESNAATILAAFASPTFPTDPDAQLELVNKAVEVAMDIRLEVSRRFYGTT